MTPEEDEKLDELRGSLRPSPSEKKRRKELERKVEEYRKGQSQPENTDERYARTLGKAEAETFRAKLRLFDEGVKKLKVLDAGFRVAVTDVNPDATSLFTELLVGADDFI